ncbi:hypothetical protein QFC24_004710 [Naganishia onofrii]|uniref:Uncharacterized protein n=1 Tax=Naganishia onofrii TaxID=1851511 RepID=A0ACC2XBQ9_9TREE|nr:hypothetical protein QFC24_004710 [Naganishia onofrii]
MASVEDLIATMNSGVHVGKQGYDISALQAQLAKTLAYNPHAAVNHTFAPYQPISGTAYNPPAPVSSLNSVASTSFNGYATAGNCSQQRPNGRPMPTPQVSYSGFDAPMYSASPRNPAGSANGTRRVNEMSIDQEGDMDIEFEDMRDTDDGQAQGGWVPTGFQPHHFQAQQIPTSHQQQPQQQYDSTSYDMSTSIDLGMAGQMSPRSRSRPRAAVMAFGDQQHNKGIQVSSSSGSDDFSAFAADAFAPVLQDRHSSSYESNHGGGYAGAYDGGGGETIRAGDSGKEGPKDGWEAFRRCTATGGTRSAFAITPTNRTAPGSPTIVPRDQQQQQQPGGGGGGEENSNGVPSPWSGRLRNHPRSGYGPG